MGTLKSLVTRITVVLLLITISCVKNPTGTDNIRDAQLVKECKYELGIIYAIGDSAGSVTNDIYLSTLLSIAQSGQFYDVKISWTSNKNSLISINGMVNQPDSGQGDSVVTLTASISKGTASDVKVFNLTVKENRLFIGIVADIDGNNYKMIRIGNQIWTAENLRTTKYNDGSAIPLVTDSAAWVTLSSPAYCCYNNSTDTDFIRKNGALYNWYAIDTKKLAPAGWHIPADSEWTTLVTFLGGNSVAGGKLKEVPLTQGIYGYMDSASNEVGFSARLCGQRNSNGTFYDINSFDNWWSSTVNSGIYSWKRELESLSSIIYRSDFPKTCGYSVRCIKD
jgi:uncharacterized protein (TIGR02145 family)